MNSEDTSQFVRAAPIAAATWRWTTPEAATALATRDLPTILRTYRRINGMSQMALAEVLGYDKSYVSMIETGRRAITDVSSRRHIATRLGIPAHILGVTSMDNAEYRAMLQFGDSTVRLAEKARQAGQAVEAVNELWPLVARLEARAAEGHMDRETFALLARARVALGVSLGTVLPEEQLSAAVHWTEQAVAVAAHLDEPIFHAHTLRMHSNELRKTGDCEAAIHPLKLSMQLTENPSDQGNALAYLCRTAGENGDIETFDSAMQSYRSLVDSHADEGPLLAPFALREIEIRGLMGTGRIDQASRTMEQSAGTPANPQWKVIEQITTGEVLAASGETKEAEAVFAEAIKAAERHHLPHQVQRVIRAAGRAGLHDLEKTSETVLDKIREFQLK